MNDSHGFTGLNSYLVRCSSGELLYSISSQLTGYSTDIAIAFLWTPEEVESRLAKLSKAIPWAGKLHAVRARQ